MEWAERLTMNHRPMISGSSSGSIPAGNNYYLINGVSAASASSNGNAYTPGTGTTLTALTFTIATSTKASQMSTVAIISGGVASPRAVSSTIAALSTLW
jgi:hypothetical protein